MTKKELVANIATRVSQEETITQATAERVLDELVNTINDLMVEGDEIILPGLGKFKCVTRKERTGRNPRTGAEITIPETYVPKFQPAPRLKLSAATP